MLHAVKYVIVTLNYFTWLVLKYGKAGNNELIDAKGIIDDLRIYFNPNFPDSSFGLLFSISIAIKTAE